MSVSLFLEQSENHPDWGNVKFRFLRTGYIRNVNFLCFFIRSMKRYPNGTLTGTCSMVRGPDEEPEVERLGSERQWSSIRVLVPKRVNSLQRSTFVPRRRDQFILTDERENLAPPVPSTNVRAFIYTKTGLHEEGLKVLELYLFFIICIYFIIRICHCQFLR